MMPVPKKNLYYEIQNYKQTHIPVNISLYDISLDYWYNSLPVIPPHLFIICLDYVLRTSIDRIRENSFELTKKRSRRYPAKTITDADYADDIAILANAPNQAEILLHSLEQAATSIGLHVNAHKTECALTNRRHFHTGRNLSETRRQIHLPREQCLINRKRHQHAANEGMDSYR